MIYLYTDSVNKPQPIPSTAVYISLGRFTHAVFHFSAFTVGDGIHASDQCSIAENILFYSGP